MAADALPRTYRPSPLVRWPLHLLNAVLALTVAALAATCVVFARLDLDPPLALAAVGGGICLTLIAANAAVIRLRLVIDEQGAELRVPPWRRRCPWRGCRLERVERPGGVVALRLIAEDGRRLWVGTGWFCEFDDLCRRVEAQVVAVGGPVNPVPR